MPDHEHSHHARGGDTNEAIWKGDIGVSFWKSTTEERERRRAGHRRLLAELLPFGPGEAFTFVDLGAGTGAGAAGGGLPAGNLRVARGAGSRVVPYRRG